MKSTFRWLETPTLESPTHAEDHRPLSHERDHPGAVGGGGGGLVPIGIDGYRDSIHSMGLPYRLPGQP